MKITSITIGILLVSTMVLMGCLTFRKSNRSFTKDMAKDNIAINVEIDTWNQHYIRYIEYNLNDSAPVLIFVHGAPGSSSAFENYMKDTSLNTHYSIILVDRLGYGYSEYGKYTPLDTQAEWLNHFIRANCKNKHVYLIGHSFGGPIVALAAVKLEEHLNGTVMIAPAIDPNFEHYIAGGRLAWWKGTRWMFSKAIRVSASEKYRHTKELADLVTDWKTVKTPVLHIHGTSDGLVPYENMDFSKAHFSDSILQTSTFEGKGHLIPFTQQESIVKILLQFINKNKNIN